MKSLKNIQKSKGKNVFKGRSPILLTFLILTITIFSLSFTSAFEFDNVGKYNGETKTMTIKNSVLGIPFFELGEVAEIQLKTELRYKAQVGTDQIVARFIVDDPNDFKEASKEMQFYNKRDNDKKFDREFTYKYLTFEEETIKYKNGTQDFIFVNEVWKKLDNKIINSGQPLEIGIFTNVYSGDYVEWIPTFYGVEIDEWATFEADSDIVNGLPDIGAGSAPFVWEWNGSHQMIAGTNTVGDYQGFSWNGTRWLTNGSLDDNLPAFGGSSWSQVSVYNISEEWFLITGRNDGTYAGYKWNGSGWDVELSVNASLPILASEGVPATFYIGDNLHLVLGNAFGASYGYEWGGASWDVNTSVNASLPNNASMAGSKPNVFEFGGTTYLIMGSDDGLSYTWNWSLSTSSWDVDLDLNSSIVDVGARSKPSMFQLDDIAYLILGTNDGDFDGYNFSFDLPNPPVITLNTPVNNTNFTHSSIVFNCSASDDLNLINVSLIIDGIINETNTSGTNDTAYIFTKNNLEDADYFWSCRGADNESQFTTAGERKVTVEKVRLNEQTFNTTSYETELNNFTANITYNSSSWTDIEANLYYNSTKHPTIEVGSGDDLNFSATLSRLFVAPKITPFFWNFRLTNATGIFDLNTSSTNQTEQPILFIGCNATATTEYVNFTFKDEGNLSLLNASVPSSTFVHTLGNFTINKTLTFINNSVNENYTFCLDPPNRTLHTAFSFQYEATGYQQRVVEFAQNLSSTLTTNILYLLSDADGLFVTFQVINTAEQTISNAIINASRIIDSVETIVGTGVTNDAGTKTFWLNPNFLHTVNVFKTGFNQFTTTLFPDQTAFTINLGGTAAGGEEDFTQGITVDVFPKGTLLDPNQSIVFNYTLTSNFFTVEEFSFGIRDENGNIYANETASTNGGTLTTTLIMDYNWLISGNFTNNSRTWLIYNDTLDDDWSIRVFFSDLTLYIDDGLFGLDDFGLAIITFLTIFIFTGIMSIRYGLVSPAAVTTLMFTLVLFFDVGLGLLTNLNPIGAVPNFPTIIMGIILAGVLLKDGIR